MEESVQILLTKVIGKLILTTILTLTIIYYMSLNDGTSGIGWFIFGLIVIWGN